MSASLAGCLLLAGFRYIRRIAKNDLCLGHASLSVRPSAWNKGSPWTDFH